MRLQYCAEKFIAACRDIRSVLPGLLSLMPSACTLVLPGSPFEVLPKRKNQRASLINVLYKRKKKGEKKKKKAPSPAQEPNLRQQCGLAEPWDQDIHC